jgi:hypothetical protein
MTRRQFNRLAQAVARRDRLFNERVMSACCSPDSERDAAPREPDAPAPLRVKAIRWLAGGLGTPPRRASLRLVAAAVFDAYRRRQAGP